VDSATTTLRVVLLTTYYYPVIGGVESHARQIAGELQRRGVDVTVLTKRLDAGTPASTSIDGVAVYRVGPSGTRTRFAKWWFLPFAFAALARRRPRPDVIFCPDFRGIGIAALAAGRLLQRPVVLQAETPGALSCQSWDADLSRWGVTPGGAIAWAMKWPFRRIYSSATMYTCISREIETEARNCGVPPERLQYVPHGVDVTRFRPASGDERQSERAAAGLPRDRPICLFVGRLSIEKGVLDLLEAWKRLADRRAALVLVGPDMSGHPLDAGVDARAFVARHGMAESVVFAGPTQDPASIMRAADVFVQPSHYEAFGISTIEAMATGLPTVATRVGGMTDYLVDEENALLCDPRAPEALARQIGRLLADDQLRQRVGTRARATTVQQFDKDVVADTYERVLRRVARLC